MTLFIHLQEYLHTYCISPKSCTFLSLVDKVRSRKYVKNFFSGVPHWPPAALPGDPATSTAWPLLSAGLAALQCRKGLFGQLPEVLLSPYDFQAVNMASLGLRATVLSKAMKARLRHTTASECGQALGDLDRHCQGFRSSSGGVFIYIVS